MTKELAAETSSPFPWRSVPVDRLKAVFFVLLAVVVVADITHSILSAIYAPYKGVVDDTLHVILFAAGTLYLAAIFWLVSAFVASVGRASFKLHSVVLIAVLDVE